MDQAPAAHQTSALYGRMPDCAAIDALLDGARAARSGALILTGPAGSGKTALFRYAREQAADMRVLETTGIEPEVDLPFAALHGLLAPVTEYIDRLPEPQADAILGALALAPTREANRFAIALGTLSLLAEVANDRPLLCLVDDAHWLDQPSADALLFAARRLDADGVAMLFAARPNSELFSRDSHIREHRLVGLDANSAAMLLDARFATAIAPSTRDAIVRVADGNPLALSEIASALSPEQLAGEAALPDPLPIGGDLQRLLFEQVRRLSNAQRTLLLVASADGSGDTDVVLAAAGELGVNPAVLAELKEVGLIATRDGKLDVRHPMLRSSAYESASFDERRAVHAALAAALPGEANADRRAWHRAALVFTPDDALADELERTADRARARLGHGAAFAALRRSAQLTVSDDLRGKRLVAAARSAWDAGQFDDAEATLRSAQSEVSAKDADAEILRLRGLLELSRGVPLEGARALLEGAERPHAFAPERTLEVLADVVICASLAGEFELVARAGEIAATLELGNDPGARYVEFLAALAAARNTTSADDWPRLLAALDAMDAATDPRWLMLAGAAAGFAGDPRRDEALLARAEFVARQSAAVGMLAIALEWHGIADIYRGDIKSAALRSGEGLALAAEHDLTNSASVHKSILAWVAAVEGDEERCLTLAREAAAHAAPRQIGHAVFIANWAIGVLHLGLGRWDAATVALQKVMGTSAGTGQAGYALRALADRVEGAANVGRIDIARAAASQLEDFAREREPDWAVAFSTRCNGLLAGRSEETERLLRMAVDLHPNGHSFHRARTELLLGEHLRRERRRKEARIPLQSALEVFQDLGAAPWADRASRELRASGLTPRTRNAGETRALTLQEEQIAEMVGDGMSNKDVAAVLFLSPRTVDYHLRNVFSKLGITNRAELIRLRAAEPTA